jgi:hypothetical protein
MGLACGILGVQWTSSVVPPALLGWYGLLVAAVQLGVVVTHQGWIKHVQKTWTKQCSAKAVFRNGVAASLAPAIWLAIALLAVLAILRVTGNVPATPAIYLWLLVANLGVVIGTVVQTALHAEGRYWPAFIVAAVGSISRSFGPPLGVMLLGATLAVMANAFLIHLALLIAAGAFFLAAPRGGVATTAARVDPAPRNMGFLAAAGLSGWLAAAAPRWIAALILDDNTTGFFVLAGNLSLAVPASVGSILLSYSFPKLFEQARIGASAKQLTRYNQRVVATVVVGSQIGILALAGLTPWLVGTIIAPQYADAARWLLPTGNAILAATTAQFFHNVLIAQDRESDCFWLSAVSLTVRVGTMFVGAAAGVEAFRWSLILLPYVTVLIEAGLLHLLLRRASAATMNASGHEAVGDQRPAQE